MPHDYHIARERMVREQLEANGIRNERVLTAMRTVPRHRFLGGDAGSEAYSRHAFPIGFSQTMSQPYMVAYLTEQLLLEGHETVLEVGTGSGYQAAVVSSLVPRVYSIERIRELAERARGVLDALGHVNVRIKVDDGALGWPEESPFDRILLTAAATEIPESLLHQLRDGGFLLGPVSRNENEQEIIKLVRQGTKFFFERLKDCTFVPLIRDGRGHDTSVISDLADLR